MGKSWIVGSGLLLEFFMQVGILMGVSWEKVRDDRLSGSISLFIGCSML